MSFKTLKFLNYPNTNTNKHILEYFSKKDIKEAQNFSEAVTSSLPPIAPKSPPKKESAKNVPEIKKPSNKTFELKPHVLMNAKIKV